MLAYKQLGTSSSTSGDNNTTGASSCSYDNNSISNTSRVGLLQEYGSIINSNYDVDDYSVSDDSDSNRNNKKNIPKKEKLVILLVLLVKLQYQN